MVNFIYLYITIIKLINKRKINKNNVEVNLKKIQKCVSYVTKLLL